MGVKTKLLFSLFIIAQPPYAAGPTARGLRQFTPFTGVFRGPGVKGKILSGLDAFMMLSAPYTLEYLMTHPETVVDGAFDVRCVLLPDGGDLKKDIIYMAYKGSLSASWKIWGQLHAANSGIVPLPDPSSYYMRTAPRFETGSKDWSYLNHKIGVGIASFVPPNQMTPKSGAKAAVSTSTRSIPFIPAQLLKNSAAATASIAAIYEAVLKGAKALPIGLANPLGLSTPSLDAVVARPSSTAASSGGAKAQPDTSATEPTQTQSIIRDDIYVLL